MNDRSEGGSAFNEGNIEIMINRRANTSDSLGNDEALNETDIVTERAIRVNAKYYLTFTKTRENAFANMKDRYLKT